MVLVSDSKWKATPSWPFSPLHFESVYCLFQKWRLCLVYLILIVLLLTCHCARDISVCFFCLHRGFSDHESAFFADLPGGMFDSSERHICPERWVSLLLSCRAPINACVSKYFVLPRRWYLALMWLVMIWKICFVEFYVNTPFSELRENHFYHPTGMPWLTWHPLPVLSLFAWALFCHHTFGNRPSPRFELSWCMFALLRSWAQWCIFFRYLLICLENSPRWYVVCHIFFHSKLFVLLLITIWWMCSSCFQMLFSSICSNPAKIYSLSKRKQQKD